MIVLGSLSIGLLVWLRWWRLADAPRQARIFSPLTGLVLFYAMVLLGLVGAAATAGLVIGDEAQDEQAVLSLAGQSVILIGHYAAQTLVVVVLLWLGRRAVTPPDDGRLGVGRSILIGAGALALFWPIVQCTAAAAGYVAERVSGEPVDTIAHDTLSLILDSPVDGWLVLMGVLVVIVAPLLEEVMYRGILQRTLVGIGMGRWPAILMVSVIFALMHVGVARWHALAALLVLSVGLGWVYEKTGRLSAAISMHVLFNAANLGLGWFAFMS
jgi:membrane protease YdiL (CAAX protease family)